MNDYWDEKGNRSPMYPYTNKSMLIVAIVMLALLMYSCATEGYRAINKEMVARDKAIQAHLEQMKHPLKWSEPYEFYTVWSAMGGGRDINTTKGDK